MVYEGEKHALTDSAWHSMGCWASLRPARGGGDRVRPYVHIPAELANLSYDLVTHTTEHHRMDHFRAFRSRRLASASQRSKRRDCCVSKGPTFARSSGKALGWNTANPGHLSPLGHIRHQSTPAGSAS